MSLTRLSYFVAVAEELSFTRASARLHVSQPPLTQQIQRLEDELGEQLIVRSTRRISLTPAGEALLPEARRMLQDYEQLPALLHDAAHGRETLSMGCVPSAIIGLMPQLLADYRNLEPGISVRVRELNVEKQIPMLKTSELDVGVFRSHRPYEDWPSFELIADHYCVVLPVTHRLSRPGEVRWSDLAPERFVMADRSRAPLEFDSVVAACVSNGFSPNAIAEAVSGYNLVALVASGLGVGVVPQRVTALKQDGAIYRPLVPSIPAVPLRLAVRGERLSGSVRRLIEVAETIPVPRV